MGGGSGGLVGLGGGVRVDVNEELKFLGKFGKKRIEGIAQCTKRYCTIFRK